MYFQGFRSIAGNFPRLHWLITSASCLSLQKPVPLNMSSSSTKKSFNQYTLFYCQVSRNSIVRNVFSLIGETEGMDCFAYTSYVLPLSSSLILRNIRVCLFVCLFVCFCTKAGKGGIFLLPLYPKEVGVRWGGVVCLKICNVLFVSPSVCPSYFMLIGCWDMRSWELRSLSFKLSSTPPPTKWWAFLVLIEIGK